MNNTNDGPCMAANLPLYEKMHEFLGEYTEDVRFDRLNIADKAMECPAIKAKWTSRYITYLNMLDATKKQFNLKMKEVSLEIRNKSPVALSPAMVTVKAIDDYPVIQALQERIDIIESLIRQTDNILKTVRYLANDISNIIDTQKLELL